MNRLRKFYSRNKIGARKSLFFDWIRVVVHLIFPVRCLCCEALIESKKNGKICDTCFATFTFLKSPKCPVCGIMYLKSGGDDHLCGECLENEPYFTKAQSLVRYSKEVGHLIHKFKFGGDLSVLSTFGSWSAKFFCNDLKDVDYIIPVPLYKKRIQERGFNQANLLAKEFFLQDRHKIKHFLKRIKYTKPQTKLSGELRRKNLKDCFKLVDEPNLHGKVIYLVDDVYTTGTTVNECAKVLVKAGAKRVEVFTLAMVVKENEM